MADGAEQKLHVVGGDRYTTKEFDLADGYRPAADFLSHRLSSRWSISHPLGKHVTASLVEAEKPTSQQLVGVEINQANVGTFARSSSSEVGIDYTEHLLIAHVGPFSNGTWDRGLLYISGVTMRGVLLPEHGLDADSIAELLQGVFARGSEFVDGLAARRVDIPYASPYPEEITV